MQKKLLMVLGVILFAAAGFFGWLKFSDIFTEPETNTNEELRDDNSITEDTDIKTPEFDKAKYSTEEPGSIWWVVNRQRSLPDGYAPDDLTVPDVRLRLGAGSEQMQISGQIEPMLKQMFIAANAEDVQLVFGSGYRSQALQAQFYNDYVARDGQLAADRYSARPGTSEHQTGLSFDVTSPSQTCHLETCFKDTPQGKWVAEHAHEHGFIIRYPEGKENVTGYQYEPWHLRYVGTELATKLHEVNQTMEEFFSLDPVPFP